MRRKLRGVAFNAVPLPFLSYNSFFFTPELYLYPVVAMAANAFVLVTASLRRHLSRWGPSSDKARFCRFAM
jgi:hypothetical protein